MAAFFKKNKEKKSTAVPLEAEASAVETAVKSEEAVEGQGNVLNQLVGNLGSALEENVEEMDQLLTDNTDTVVEASPKTKSHRGFIVVGAIVLVLSIIGAVSTVRFISSTVYDIADQRALKQEFTKFIYPVVITDPPEFSSVEYLHSSTIIASSLWKIILFNDTSHYEKDMGIMTVPAIDVEASARSLFGYGYEIEHRSIEDVEFLFEYDSSTNSYIVPEKTYYTTYAPKIVELSSVGELYTIKVNYISPSPLASAGIASEDDTIKTLIYTVSRSKGKMAIHSIEIVPVDTNQLAY